METLETVLDYCSLFDSFVGLSAAELTFVALFYFLKSDDKQHYKNFILSLSAKGATILQLSELVGELLNKDLS